MTAKLRLGPLPKAKPVRLTITISAELKATLDRYAEMHSQSNGETNDITRLIPYMLETFVDRDRAFQQSCRAATQSTTLP